MWCASWLPSTCGERGRASGTTGGRGGWEMARGILPCAAGRDAGGDSGLALSFQSRKLAQNVGWQALGLFFVFFFLS